MSQEAAPRSAHQEALRSARRVALRRALISLIESVADSGRMEIFLEPAVVEQLRELTALLDDDIDPLPRTLLGWAHWYRHECLPEGQNQPDLVTALQLFFPYFMTGDGPQSFPGLMRPMLAGLAEPRAVDMISYLQRSDDVDRMSAGVGLWQRIVAATGKSDPGRPRRLANLANTLMIRSGRTDSGADLEEAIGYLEDALAAMPDDEPGRVYVLTNLGGALRDRFGRSGVPADLDLAIGHLEDALEHTPEGDPELNHRLSNLASALQTRFKLADELPDLNEAITRLTEAAAITPADSPGRPDVLDNLGTALRVRFDRTGVPADLSQAIENLEEALTVVSPDARSSRAYILNNYGNALCERWEQTGAQGDLDDAITYLRQATDITPLDHPERRNYLSNAGNTLRRRFGRLGVQADLDEAIGDLRDALAATPADRPAMAGRLSDLAAGLLTQFGRTEVPGDLDEAIGRLRQAVAGTPPGPDRPGRLSNLGAALQTRFERTGWRPDLDGALASLEQAVASAKADAPYLVNYRSNLAGALLARFDVAGDAADLTTAIGHLEAAVAATPGGHPQQADYLFSLGLARLRAGAQADPGQADLDQADLDQADLDQAAAYLERAANVRTAAPSLRIRAARLAADITWAAQPSRAAGLARQAALLLPEVAPRRQARTDQQYALGGFGGLAADAAALTLRDPARPENERAELALQLLETGRAVLLGQALQARRGLADLAERHPELADRFARLRDLLDAPEPVSDRVLLSGELDLTLAQIRAQAGFETFARPPAVAELVAEAGSGPVVVFSISRYGSDALLLTGAGIRAMPLPGLDFETVVDRAVAFHEALDLASSGRTPQARRGAQQELRDVLRWLWEHGTGPVLDALGYRAEPAPGTPWPQVWWAPGGLLGLLPVHAAGQTMDRVVSSYTFTIAALRRTRRLTPAPDPATALIVAMPTTPGLAGGLDYVADEARNVATHWPRSITLIEPGPGESGDVPTSARVLELLPGCAVAHFACHGTTDPADPGRSHLFLHDHLTVAALASVNLAHARLAYLSACSTAVTADTALLDEAIHLASAFQLAGYPHVIGTSWTTRDERAIEIADSFYAALADGTPAAALHHAVRAMRDRFPATPSLWGAYLHVGA